MLVAMLVVVLAAPALAEPPGNSIRGSITEVSRSAEVVLVEEDPSDEWGSAKGEFAVTDETEILAQQGGDLAPVAFEDLRVGQMVEATYSGPVAESYPTQGSVGRIVILDGDRTDNPDDGGLVLLPDTGGVPLAVLVALLIGGALLARRVSPSLLAVDLRRPRGECSGSVHQGANIRYPRAGKLEGVDYVAEAVAGTLQVRVLEIPLSFHGEPLDRPPMLRQLLLVVPQDLLRGCSGHRELQGAPRRRFLQRSPVHFVAVYVEGFPRLLASVVRELGYRHLLLGITRR
jgi:hypothetical protein